MLNMFDAVLAVVLMGVVLYGFTTLRTDLVDTGEAQRVANAYVDLHESLQSYLDNHYPIIERCMGGDRWAERWRARQRASLRGDTSARRPPNYGQLVPIPLFNNTALLTPAATDVVYGGRRTGGEGLAVLRTMPGTDCLPPLGNAGVLAPGFRRLTYVSGAAASDHLFDDRYDFRAAIRLVNLDEVPDALDPVVALQIVLVMRTPAGEPMPLAHALRVAELTRLPEVGILSSQTIGAARAERTVAGLGDGWRLDVCVPPAALLTAENTAETALARPGATTAALALADATQKTTLGLEACAADSNTALGWRGPEVLPVILPLQHDPVARLFSANTAAALAERFSGQPVDGTGPENARVVSLIQRSRTAALRDVLYRTPVEGLPARQRMEADLDLGAFGLVNVGFATGVDTDGDGLVNQGMQIVGPPVIAAGNTTQAGFVPTTVHGPLHVRGPLVLTGPNDPYPADLRANFQDNNFPPGALVVTGGSFFGPADPQVLLQSAPCPTCTPPTTAPIAPATVADATGVASTVPLNVHAPRAGLAAPGGATSLARVFRSPGAIRVHESADVVHMDPAAFHVLVDRSSRGHQRPPIVLTAGANAVAGATVQTDAVRIDTHGNFSAIGLVNQGNNGGIRVRTNGTDSNATVRTTGDRSTLTLITTGGTSPLGLRTHGANSRLDVETMAATSPMDLQTWGAGSEVRLRTNGAGSRMAVRTLGANSRMDLITVGATSPMQAVTRASPMVLQTTGAGAASALSVQTTGVATPLVVQTLGAGSLLDVETEGVGSSIRVRTLGSTAPLVVRTANINSPLTVVAANTGSPLMVRADQATAGVTVRSNLGSVVIDDLDLAASDTLPRGTGREHTLQTMFSSIVPDAAVNTAATAFPTTPACPAGFTAVRFIVPTGWSRTQFAASLDRTIRFTVPGHGTTSATFTTHEPYTGWSINPATGADDATGGVLSAGSFDFTGVSLCRFVG